MCARSRAPVVRSVKTPEALAALRTWLDTFDDGVRERGLAYFKAGKVAAVRANADHYFDADVLGAEKYLTTLFFNRGRWTSQCTCSRQLNCKHVYAVGLAWLDSAAHETPPPDPNAPSGDPTPDPVLRPFASSATVTDPAAFRDHWSPVIAGKLRRPLSTVELHRLESLAGLFADFAQAHGVLYPGVLIRHGFEYTPPIDAPLYAPAFPGWWERATAPTDPWELWNYIALDYERESRPLPEVFRPLTDTSALRGLLEARLVQHDLGAWQRALAMADGIASGAPLHPATADLTGLRARVRAEGGLLVETRTGNRAWRIPAQKWFTTLVTTRPIDFEHFTPAEAALGLALAAECRAAPAATAVKNPLPPEIAGNLFRTRAAREAIVLPNGRPLTIEPDPLALEAAVSRSARDRLDLHLVTPDGRNASLAALITLYPNPLYLFEDRVWAGPPPTPSAPLPTAALGDAKLMTRLRAAGLRLPASLESNVRRIPLRPFLKCWLTPVEDDDEAMEFHVELVARADDFPFEQHYLNTGWQWTTRGTPPPRKPGDPLLEFDLTAAQVASARLPDFRLEWHAWGLHWGRPVTKAFPEEFIAWHASLPTDLRVETSSGLANLLGPPLRAHVVVEALPAEAVGRDWFNLSVELRVADVKLTPAELSLLMKARGKWVRLAKHGWQRLEVVDDAEGPTRAALERLGLDTADVIADGERAVHRIHTLQLAAEAGLLEARDQQLADQLRTRAHALAVQAPPPLPAGLRATLRPYQLEGFHFLAHLSSLGLGGVLADDMGLGKTVQTLAWLLYLQSLPRPAPAAKATPFHTLVVCPKSVMHGWLTETARFAPALDAAAFNPIVPIADTPLLVANYSQLRLHREWFQRQTWDAVVLDEGQFIKNPSSQVAATTRALRALHRIVLTGTPVENRLTDLWSLFSFAQPGLLGTLSAFRRHYNELDPTSVSRLHRRVRHFLLRRTKAQAAPDLPPRTEDDLIVELEGEQRVLYDAELKRARSQLLGIDTNQALAAVRFNVLASLLRLRQICCHPALVDPAHADLPSAKLEALLERLEELQEEGHQVLVFSQFVEMLQIIRRRLSTAGIGHLMITGSTENRAELVDQFQSDRTKTVFLLSLKAAGFGLNLTAASYAILYDPWWNPAAEAQAIDRTHRIGQTQPVVAYRLLADNTVEQKIRLMQRDKAALAAAVVQEESLASILDLDSLKRILE